MTNVLSQEEIEALLGGLLEGQIKANAEAGFGPPAEKAVSVFDFSDPERFTRGRMPVLETIHARFAQRLRQNFTAMLRRPLTVQVNGQNVCSFHDFGRSLEKPVSLNVLGLDPLKGSALLVLPARLVLALVDLLFGGEGRHIEISEDRDFTQIENRVISRISAKICELYSEVWTSVYPVTARVTASETNVRFINFIQPAACVHAVDFEAVIDGRNYGFAICLPLAAIEPIKNVLQGSSNNDNGPIAGEWKPGLGEKLLGATVELRGILGSATITGRDLLQMKKGDILQLNEDFEHPVEITVEGVRKFWSFIGAHKSGRALQITDIEEVKGKVHESSH